MELVLASFLPRLQWQLQICFVVDMGKISFAKVLHCFCVSSASSSCLCMNVMEAQNEFERRPLIAIERGMQLQQLKDVFARNQTLPFQLKPKMVVLRVSMHCNGCARKVKKHISKMNGVTAYKVDLENKMVVVIGDVLPFEVLERISKVKNAELWNSPC